MMSHRHMHSAVPQSPWRSLVTLLYRSQTSPFSPAPPQQKTQKSLKDATRETLLPGQTDRHSSLLPHPCVRLSPPSDLGL